MKEVQQHLHWWKLEPFCFFSAKHCKKIASAAGIFFTAFKDRDCMFCARVRKTSGARNCCVPELLALKGLILVTIMNYFAGHFSIRAWEKQQKLVIVYSEEVRASSNSKNLDPFTPLSEFLGWDIAKCWFLYCAFCSLGTEFSGNSKQGLYFHCKVQAFAVFLEALLKLFSDHFCRKQDENTISFLKIP